MTTLNPLPRPDAAVYGRRVVVNRGIVARVRKRTHDTYELVVKLNENSSPLNAAAGQFATLWPDAISRPRSYSFALAPEMEAEGEHTFFIRYVEGGEFSGWLAERDRTGESLTISGPLGKFLLDDSDDTMICVAGGSGMSAINALLQHAVAIKAPRDAFYFYSARSQDDLYCQEEMQEIAAAWHPDYQFTFIPSLSREPAESDWTGVRARATSHIQDAYINQGQFDLNCARAYFCGPPGMIDTGMELLIDGGMSRDRIYFDKFEDTSSPAPFIDNSKCVLCDECLFVRATDNCIVEASRIYQDKQGRLTGYERVQPASTSGLYYNSLFIDERECIRCGSCVEACPANAISVDYENRAIALRSSLVAPADE